MVDRAVLLSDKKLHNFNLQFIKDLLSKNAYPEGFIDSCVTERK